MSKCDEGLLGLYADIFQDIKRAYPAMEKDLSKDMSSLRRSIECRGVELVAIHFVSLARHFDRCLAKGQYSPSGLPLTKRCRAGEQAPRFLRRLFLLVFNPNGSLKDCPDIQAIFFIRQIYLLAKKARLSCPQDAIDREVKRLIDHDKTLPQPNVSWDSEEGEVNAQGFTQGHAPLLTSDADFRRRRVRQLLWVLDRVSGILTSSLGVFTPSMWRFRHGPGAVSEGPRNSDKYSWNSWEPILESEFPIADYGFHSYASWARSLQLDELPSGNLVASRLVAVPKTLDTPRLIAAEPASKQWCQQALLDYFYTRAKGCWIHKFVRFDDQTQNQELCRLGSRTGDLCTIDLSAASDSVSCWFVGNLFRANPTLLRALRAVRTRHLRQTISRKSPEVTRLRKYSMMGSAVTFPIESLGFLAICLSGVLVARGLRPTLQNIRAIEGVSVFGDDLIIPRDSWEHVTDLLEVCYFKVNTHKSFNEGNFRESCGVDSFRGEGVTPAYWRGPYTCEPEDVLALGQLHNHLYNRWLLTAAQRIGRMVDLPPCSTNSGAVGLQSRLPVVISAPNRYCHRHQVWKVLVPTFTSRSQTSSFDDDRAIFQYFTEKPSPLTKWSNGLRSRIRLSRRMRWIPVHCLTATGEGA